MDVRALLAEVAQAYEDLVSPWVDVVWASEFGEEHYCSHSEQRSKACLGVVAAPHFFPRRGGAHVRPDKDKYLETWHSTEWDGETLLDRSNLRLRDMDLSFERRLTFSEDKRNLHIAERISGPEGQTQGTLRFSWERKGPLR